MPRMDVRKLLDGYKRVLSEIYDPDRYFDRCLDLLKSVKTAPDVRTGGSPSPS